MLDQQQSVEEFKAQSDTFVQQLLAWWDTGHRDLPWRRSPDPYAVWVSEIMLQQTQITTVIPYYERWMARFPTVLALAAASLEDVLKMWQGLGYYSRARNLLDAARIVAEQYNGQIPSEPSALCKLPGIGRYTAGAIASIAFNKQAAVVEGNVIRVLSRLIDLNEDVTRSDTQKLIWALARDLVPQNRPGDYNQALMELGQTICSPVAPDCYLCPVSDFCQAFDKGTQYERPVRPPRKRVPHYDVVAGIIWRTEQAPEGEFLIARRPLNGMLGGLWEFPGGKVEGSESFPEALQREIAEELAIDIDVGDFAGTIEHAYTHFRISLHVYVARLTGGKVQNIGVSDHAWVTLSDLDQYAFAVTDLKIIDILKRTIN